VHPVTFRNPFERTSQPLHDVSRNASTAFLVVAVIPARYHSTRLPGKPLADIGGRPMIEHVYRRAAAARGVDAVVVATDDERIASAVERFGGIARMTQPSHRTGTDRIAEVARDLDCDIVVNVQGDLPLIEPDVIADAIAPLDRDRDLQMSTVRRRITDEADYANPNVVKVVVDRHGNALYFSRSPIPFLRDDGPAAFDDAQARKAGRHVRAVYKHLGLYVYRRTFLFTVTSLPQTPLENAESLEQLRVLEHGYRIATVDTEYDSIEVDTPDDLERVRRLTAVGTSA
jgi:3-deoxy-manno-octulosonate cytidylyltransferase (CMP-KDO synthetase)